MIGPAESESIVQTFYQLKLSDITMSISNPRRFKLKWWQVIKSVELSECDSGGQTYERECRGKYALCVYVVCGLLNSRKLKDRWKIAAQCRQPPQIRCIYIYFKWPLPNKTLSY